MAVNKPQAIRTVVPIRTPLEGILIEALAKLLDSGLGFSDIDIDQLVSEAGISRARFFLHFQNKSDILECFMRQLIDELSATIRTYSAHDSSAFEQLDATVRQVIAVIERHQPLLIAMLDSAAFDPRMRGQYKSMLADIVARSKKILQKVQNNPLARHELQPEVAESLVYMFERYCYQLPYDLNIEAQERSTAAMVHVIWHSLFTDPTTN